MSRTYCRAAGCTARFRHACMRGLEGRLSSSTLHTRMHERSWRESLYASHMHASKTSRETCTARAHAQAYGHAYDLASCFAEVPMGVEVLVQIDRLVQLLETPSFNFLRLHLLHPARYPALLWRAHPPAATCSIEAFTSSIFVLITANLVLPRPALVRTPPSCHLFR